MVPIDFLILKMVLKALTQHLDYILTGEDDIAAFVDGACIGHAFKLRHIGTASRDIHCQSQVTHPLFHSQQSFNSNILFGLANRRYAPYILRQATEFLLGIL